MPKIEELFGSVRLGDIAEEAAQLYLSAQNNEDEVDIDTALQLALQNNGVYNFDGGLDLKIPSEEDRRFLAAVGDVVWERIKELRIDQTE